MEALLVSGDSGDYRGQGQRSVLFTRVVGAELDGGERGLDEAAEQGLHVRVLR
jgi:hypothetical protein